MRRPPEAAEARRPGLGGERPGQLDDQHPEADEDRSVRVDPEQAQQRQGDQPARVAAGPGQQVELDRQPHEREVEAAVAHQHARQAQRQHHQNERHPAAARPQRAHVRPRGHQAQAAQPDGVEGIGPGAEGPEQAGQRQLGPPLVGDPAPVRLGVAEGVEADHAVVRQHPLAGGQRPELVVRQRVPERHRGDEGDAEGQPDQLNGPRRHAAVGGLGCGRRGRSSGRAGRRDMECLDGLRARPHCSPLVPVPPPGSPMGTLARPWTNSRRRTVAIAWFRFCRRRAGTLAA